MLTLAKLALAPLLLMQGRAVRRQATRLPEPPGEREGVLGADAQRQRLLIVGDSATAGVGVGHQREALASLLASRLAEAGPATIEWRLIARRGATTADALRLLDESLAPRAQVDIAVVAVGVNDVTGQAPLRRWLLEMEALVQRLERRHGARLLVVSGLPPMHLFAALPQPLRWYLGACARRYDAALREWAAKRPATLYVPMALPLDPALMAEDGFHPGPSAYALWAAALAGAIRAASPAARSAGEVRPAERLAWCLPDRSRRRSGSPR